MVNVMDFTKFEFNDYSTHQLSVTRIFGKQLRPIFGGLDSPLMITGLPMATHEGR